MTIPEQAVEAAAERAYLNNRAGETPWVDLEERHKRDWRIKVTSVLAAAQPFMGVERAVPPLRAREEIARATLSEIAAACEERTHPGGPVLTSHRHLEDLRAIAAKARGVLSCTAGQEWRDISSAPKDGPPIDLWMRSRSSGATQRYIDAVWAGGWCSTFDNTRLGEYPFSDYEATHWMPLPAPPVAEPIVAEKSGVK